MIKKLYAIVCALSLITALPAFGMETVKRCSQCNNNMSQKTTLHTTYLASPYLLSFPLPFQSAEHRTCGTCEDHIQNIKLSPLQKLGCKHCFMQKNPTYAGCSNMRFWSEIALLTVVASYICYKAYNWYKGEDAQENEQNTDADNDKQEENSQEHNQETA